MFVNTLTDWSSLFQYRSKHMPRLCVPRPVPWTRRR